MAAARPTAGGLIGIGGTGGKGGNGDQVTVENRGAINTYGSQSRGIVAQSIGGGGGDGGFAAGILAIGGTGAGGGISKEVTILNEGDIFTQGTQSSGIVAQSIGGGGGNGGSTAGFVSVGGRGGTGGAPLAGTIDGSTVSITQSGKITTMGKDSNAIVAQSIGGGGGNGGTADDVGAFGSVAIGGSAGTGAKGGAVNVTLQGHGASTASSIITNGDRSNGVFAQSVGGGGGNGGGSVAAAAGLFGAESLAIGGQGGKGGDGNVVTLSPGTGADVSIETHGRDSAGVVLQSVGGGGGNGGYAVSVAASGGLLGDSLAVAIGGAGDEGGKGDAVNVGTFDAQRNLVSTGFNGSIHTTGERSTGFVAQSVGGGGGNGGLAVTAAGSASLVFSDSVSVGIGGKGEGGGNGGNVSVGTSGDITTEEASSTGMLVQSIGGGGGNGGGAIGASFAAGGGGAAAVSVGVGGEADKGGDGLDVTVATRAGKITTSGENSSGIVIESVGGGGGNGGYSIATGVAVGGVGAGAVTAALGGAGGAGGKGGKVKADIQSDVTTGATLENGSQNQSPHQGENSTGVLVQSVGGGGGNGGFSIAVGGAGAGVGSGAVSVGLGGDGGTAGNGDEVVASSAGTITTYKAHSSGFVAQSLGGGGGNGGFNVSGALSGAGVASGAVTVGLGGGGGNGGEGGVVNASTSGKVETHGDSSTGVLAQSVGGGGGNGGFNVDVAISGSGVISGAVGVGLGGTGGEGSIGKSVTLHVDDTVTTSGSDSAAVVAQSIGGGGGNGGFNVTTSASGAGVASGGVSVGLGGRGGKGGVAGTVETWTSGDVTTSGARSTGILAQSVGGGGGNGGFNVDAAISAAGVGSGAIGVGLGGTGGKGSNGNTVDLHVANDVTTLGQDSAAIIAQSVGGGGGNGGFNVTVAGSAAGVGSGAVGVGIGGNGAGGGNGALAKSDVKGNIRTEKSGSTGLLTQSVGGGGGNGGFDVTAAINAAGTAGGGASIGLGGSGGDGGSGGEVQSGLTGNVTTLKDRAAGVVAQSIGGGGGNGALTVTGEISLGGTASGGASVGIGGSGGSGGSSVAATTLIVNGDVRTEGAEAGGVLAQSVGGGGGNGGLTITGSINASGGVGGAVGVGVGGSGGTGGNAFAVDSTVTGDVTTLGDKSAGVIAQSIGGGGGNGGMTITAAVNASMGEGGSVAVGIGGTGGGGGQAQKAKLTVNGDVSTSGADSGGVLAQSVGGGGGNGGINIEAGVAVTGNTGGSVNVGVGGSGGTASNGGEANLTVNGDVSTTRARSNAITAQSIGGGGGTGGMNVSGGISASLAGAASVAVGVGGSGGGGGNGSLATALVTGNARTGGDDSHGFVVQSVGGGGGSGGMNVTGVISASGAGAGSLAVGVGGFGGDGGTGGAVDGTLDGGAHTSGNRSYGVLMQSVGGGGGNGALNVSAVGSVAKETSGAASIGIGGFGGKGGNASTVLSTVKGDVGTTGDESIGVLAQSLGGGGGNGGINVSGVAQLTTDGAAAAAVGIGGFGAGAGAGEKVTLVRTGKTETDGADSHGVVAQSIGGGGGNGGLNVSSGITGTTKGNAFSATIGLGGFGGGGGNGGEVDATVTGDVSAKGLASDSFKTDDGITHRVREGGSNGVLAQSVGGAGGNGGLNVSGGISVAPPKAGKSNALTFGLGGFGGSGGDANTVKLTVNADTVRSVGDDRFGVGAQSIGGGGGNGGTNVSGGIVMDGQITAGIGGFGGKGGKGSTVNATANTDIFAAGERAIGFMAQSVGGGGGNGGVNVSGGLQASTTTEKPSLVFGLGGQAGDGNTSDKVTAVQKGAITVEGADSIGVLAQSVAGGGGNGGLNVSGNLALGKGYSAAVGIGGTGGTGAIAGAVDLTSDGAIFVDGREAVDLNHTPDKREVDALKFRERANGILAQSVGGGGGNGGMNVTGVLAPSGSPLAAGVGGKGSLGGDGGTVLVKRGLNEASTLVTRGDNANALTAQSIGGGGGNAGMNFVVEATFAKQGKKESLITIGGGAGQAGNGNTVDVTHAGTIATEGKRSDGILAQSIGGGGGNANVNFGAGVNRNTKGLDVVVGGGTGNGGTGNTVSVNHTGTIATQGVEASAIFAQSVGGGGGNAEADDSQVADFLTAPDIAQDILSDAISDEDGTTSLNVSIGRKGGTGGVGGNVSVKSNGALSTLGERAVGVFAQSAGNAGGVSGTSSAAFSKSTDVSLQVGLEGGEGGRSGAVDVTTSGSISTSGANAHAIQAQSVGGGGGVGGAVTSDILQGDKNTVSVGIGGSGGTGGIAGIVGVHNSAALSTVGESAHGIFAQSVGGGGGAGGYAGVSATEVEKALASKAADLIKDALKKKDANEKPEKGTTTLSMLVGGNGGTGAAGSTVTVENSGAIFTQGTKSDGIKAQSVGGGGGTGGMVVHGAIAGGKGNKSLALNVGGSGGDAGTGDDVSVTNSGIIHTKGQESVGIRAQSVGGGGGEAGLLVDLTISDVGKSSSSTKVETNIGGTLNAGGFGGTGGSSGDVTVKNVRAADGTGGVILTEGTSAHGIFAQSLGGGGGNGSSIVSANFSTRGNDSVLAGFNIGGEGGSGGKSGTVDVTNAGEIETHGSAAHGIFAQSVGGGGGNGGLVLATNGIFAAKGKTALPLISIGGNGGKGADAADVTVSNTGSILTHGANSHGVYAQSLGGGGGNAGIGVGVAKNLESTIVAGLLSALMGGRGGDGGLAGNVSVTQNGDITVLGNNSRAVVIEEINGGGGHVALDFDGITTLPGDSALPFLDDEKELAASDAPTALAVAESRTQTVFSFNSGGVQTHDSTAGNVTARYQGTFGVAGNNGAADSAQAIGGGGGTYDLRLDLRDSQTAPEDRAKLAGRLGGVDGRANGGGEIDSRHTGDLLTEGTNTFGLFLQSIGGGGGRASLDVSSETGSLGASSFTLGGQNGADESGAKIAHDQSGSIVTEGRASHGAVIQSIGGGGGTLSFVLKQGPAAALAPVTLVAGSTGGSALNAGSVALDLVGPTATRGDNAAGLVLQSIGGGGGAATIAGANTLDVTLGGAGGASGNGGDIQLTNTGNLSTAGERAHGVLLQSIGGGGAAVLTSVAAPTVTTTSANSGDGGAIRFTQRGDITTQGTRAHGVIAQSLGGGGGFVDGAFAGSAGGNGAGGDVSVTVDGNIVTSGAGSTALFAQSVGGLAGGASSAAISGGDVRVLLTKDHSIVGGKGGVAVALDSAGSSLFENHGSVMTFDGLTGLAIRGGVGSDLVFNSGTIAGNVDLGGGANAMTNRVGAQFHSGTVLNLGAPENVFLNDGLFAPGAAGHAVTTRLTGSFRQSAGATSRFDLDFAADAVDSLLATGSLNLAGAVDVSLLDLYAIRPGLQTRALFRGEGGVVNNGLTLRAQPSIVIEYDLVFPDGKTAALAYDVDFAASGLRGNRIAFGNYINRIQSAGSSAALSNTITRLVLETELDAYSALLTQMGGEFYAEQQVYTLDSARQFTQVMQDCGSLDVGRIAGGKTGCVWGRVDVDASSRDAENGFPSGTQTARRYSSGVQNASGPWTYGAGIDLESNDSYGFDRNWRAEVTTAQLGVLTRRTFGATSAGATLTVGNSSQDIRRKVTVTSDSLALGKRDVHFFSGTFDVAHRVTLNGFTVTPALTLGFAGLRGEAMQEAGADALNATLAGRSETHTWVEPTLAFGYASSFSNQRFLRAYARVGLLHYLSGGTTEVRAGLAGAPSGVDFASLVSDLDRTHFTAEAGVELIALDRFTLGLSYGLERSPIRDSGKGAVRVTIPID